MPGDCFDCTSGYYCETPGLTSPTGPCVAGFYCASRANDSSPGDGVTGDVCPLGFYCPAGSGTGEKNHSQKMASGKKHNKGVYKKRNF